jgi:predicted dehydrogenase
VTQALKKKLAEGIIGDVQAIYVHGKQDGRGGGEDMIVLGTHLFNMMRLFVGDVAWMTAHIAHEGRALTVEDVREATEPVGPVAGDSINSYFAFKSGVAGFFDSRKYVDGGGARMGMEIEGSEGAIALRGGGSGPAMIYPHPVFDPTDASQQWGPLDEVADEALSTGNDLAVADLIDAAEADREPLSSARDAVAALEMILGAYEAEITGGRVEFPMQRREHPLVAWRA